MVVLGVFFHTKFATLLCAHSFVQDFTKHYQTVLNSHLTAAADEIVKYFTNKCTTY